MSQVNYNSIINVDCKNPAMTPLTTKKTIKFVPPDGGWGWVVIIGIAVSNIFNLSTISLFSLIYGDALEAMGHETQGAALVLSANLFVSNFGGPMAGAIVKLTSARFTAVLGAFFCTIGLFFSGFSTNIWHLAITYGVLLGLGQDFISNSSFVVINKYFKQKKSQAVGLANAGTNLGQMLMPHLVSYLLENYGFRGTCLILSSLSFHGVAGCLLLQPVERHMKIIVQDITSDESLHLLQNQKKLERIALRKLAESKEDLKLINKQNIEKDLGNENFQRDSIKEDCSKINRSQYGSLKLNAKVENSSDLLRKLYDLFGFSLLSNIRFIIVVIGAALTVASIINFSLIHPLFLQKVASMDKQKTAYCMSSLAAADMMGRIILPVFQDKYKLKARWVIVMACMWVIVMRQIFAYQTDFTVIIVLSILYGLGKSMVVVNRNIAITENCKMEDVPSAVGLGMLTMGLIAPPVGYFLGWIRDYTKSYIACISAQNAFMVIVIATWLSDLLYMHIKEKRNNPTASNNNIS